MILRKLQKLINNPPEETELVCQVDEEVVDCDDLEEDGLDYEDQYYTGIPAPPILEYDPWFGPPPPLTEKQEEIRAQLEEEKQLIAAEEDKSPSKEVANIHEVMYNVATNNGKTTVQLDPPGGSENFQSGPGGWMSGTGFNQF
tara:strand:+ start:3375 stop:3803 length:429 start_codon:yes stop_codon:yes gene_type:complete